MKVLLLLSPVLLLAACGMGPGSAAPSSIASQDTTWVQIETLAPDSLGRETLVVYRGGTYRGAIDHKVTADVIRIEIRAGVLSAHRLTRLQDHVASLATSGILQCGGSSRERVLRLTIRVSTGAVNQVRYNPSCAWEIGGPLRAVVQALGLLEIRNDRYFP